MSLTPEEFNKIALKKDLDELTEKVDAMAGDVSKILSAVDKITKNYENHEIEQVSNIAAHDRFEVRIKDLEESKVS